MSDPSLTNATADRDGERDVSLRPTGFSEFIGQAAVRANLEVFIEAAKKRGRRADSVWWPQLKELSS